MANTKDISRENSSQYESLPPLEVSPRYKSKPPKMKQSGTATPLLSLDGERFTTRVKPSYMQLAAWDSARRSEPIIFDGLQKMVLAIQSLIGEYYHPNKDIEKFVKANIKPLKSWAGDIAMTTLWSGSSISEIIYKPKYGPNGEYQVWIDDLVNYHPTQIFLKLDEHGRLSHGKKIKGEQFKTGVWVTAPNINSIKNRKIGSSFTGSHIRLDESKLVHVAIHSEGNNPYGISSLEPILKYHLYKEIFLEMQSTALDRYGTPLIYAIVPNQPTKESITEPDGSTRNKYYHELASEMLEDLRGQQSLVFSQTDKDHPVSLGALTTGNNFSEAFNSAIELCDNNMMLGLGIPNLILKDKNNGLGTGGASERQMEGFHALVRELCRRILDKILNQLISRIIKYNFDTDKIPSADYEGEFSIKPFRTSELDVVIKLIDKLTDKQFIDPTKPSDRNWVREMVGLPRENYDTTT